MRDKLAKLILASADSRVITQVEHTPPSVNTHLNPSQAENVPNSNPQQAIETQARPQTLKLEPTDPSASRDESFESCETQVNYADQSLTVLCTSIDPHQAQRIS